MSSQARFHIRETTGSAAIRFVPTHRGPATGQLPSLWRCHIHKSLIQTLWVLQQPQRSNAKARARQRCPHHLSSRGPCTLRLAAA